jgi:tetratricopeptide (TPR) repeat protein
MKKNNLMKKNIFKIATVLLLLSATNGLAQNIEKQRHEANSEMRRGNELYQQGHYAEAEIAYKKAMATYPGNPKSMYNTANSILQQKRYKEAIAQYDFLIKNAKNNRLKAQSYHNIGNAYMELKNYQKAVDAYKNSLRKNPKDEETRYNLALAQKLLKNQQNNQNKNDKNKENKDKKNNQNKDKNKEKNKDKKDNKEKDKDNKDKKDKDQNKDKKKDKDKDKDKDKPDDKKDSSDNKQNNKEKQQPQPGKLSPQQIQQLLNALNNEEKKTQDKVNAKKVKGQAVKTEKDW